MSARINKAAFLKQSLSTNHPFTWLPKCTLSFTLSTTIFTPSHWKLRKVWRKPASKLPSFKVLLLLYIWRKLEFTIFVVAETLSDEILTKMHASPKPDIPVINVDQLTEPDGFLFGFGTRFGTMVAKVNAAYRKKLLTIPRFQ